MKNGNQNTDQKGEEKIKWLGENKVHANVYGQGGEKAIFAEKKLD